MFLVPKELENLLWVTFPESVEKGQGEVSSGWYDILSPKFSPQRTFRRGDLKNTERKGAFSKEGAIFHFLRGLDTYHKTTSTHRKTLLEAVF